MESSPIITIGMPTYNSSWSLQSTLDAIEKLNYPKDRIRIVFVDNKSKDETLQMLKGFQGRFKGDYESVIIISELSNISKARNICVINSLGEYVLFIDSDVIPLPNTIKRMLDLFASNPRVGIVGFPYRYDPADLPHKMDLSKDKVPYVRPRDFFFTLGCAMVKRELFNEIGVFDEKYDRVEDWEFDMRTSEAGYVVMVDPTMRPLHLKRARAETYGTIRQIIRYCVTFLKSSDRSRAHTTILLKYKPRWLINRMIFYLMMAVSIPLAIVGVFMRSIPLVLPLVTCYGVVFAYHFPKASGKWRLINSILFPLFGMSFAIGMLKEIVKYYLLGRRLKS